MREFLYYWSGGGFPRLRRVAKLLRAAVRATWIALRVTLIDLGILILNTVVVAAIVFLVVLASIYLGVPPGIPRIVFVALMSGAMASLYFTFLRIPRIERYQDYERQLKALCRADSEPYNAMVRIRTASSYDRENFVHEFDSVPMNAKTVLLLLRQTRKRRARGKPPYNYDSIRRQIEWRNAHPRASKIKIDWVCFVTRHHTFEAYQSYAKFEVEVLERKNPEYAAVLCKGDLVDFRKEMDKHIQQEKEQKRSGTEKPNTIPGLRRDHLPDVLTKKQVLYKLVEASATDRMLVTDDRKPIGVVTLVRLMHDTLLKHIQTPADVKKLDKTLADWTIASTKLVADVEANDEPSPPDETSDDDPEYDAMVPFGGAPRRRPLYPDLRFTPP